MSKNGAFLIQYTQMNPNEVCGWIDELNLRPNQRDRDYHVVGIEQGSTKFQCALFYDREWARRFVESYNDARQLEQSYKDAQLRIKELERQVSELQRRLNKRLVRL